MTVLYVDLAIFTYGHIVSIEVAKPAKIVLMHVCYLHFPHNSLWEIGHKRKAHDNSIANNPIILDNVGLNKIL